MALQTTSRLMGIRLTFIRLMFTAMALLCAVILVLLGFDLKSLAEHILDFVQGAGPVAFFLAMTLLPAIGFPLSLFCLTAGSAFGPQLGMPAVMLLCLSAVAANIALSHLLAGRGLRPSLDYLLQRLGRQFPRQVPPAEATSLIVLVRVAPGLPFAAQNYLLGLARVPFTRYFFVSCLIAFPLNAAIIVFGEALLKGRGRLALFGLLLLLAVMVAVRLLGRHYRDREKTSA